MAEQQGRYSSEETNVNKAVAPETTDRGCGLFNFMGKKEDQTKPAHDDTVMVDLVDTTPNYVVEPAPKEKKEEEKHGFMDKLHRTHSNSSSSSDEELDEVTGEKKRKKKGLKEKIKEKISGDKQEGIDQQKVEYIPTENYPAHVVHANPAATHTHEDQEKKGIMDKIKDKLPGHHNKTDEVHGHHPSTTPEYHEQVHGGGEAKEKKGLLDKIKEKLPGGHHKNNEDDLEKHKCN